VPIASILAALIAGTLPAPPALLSQTGLYARSGQVDPRNRPYAPQYPLWSDGAAKTRWIRLPGAIRVRSAADWEFPVGTKVWKEFQFDGRKVETRLLWKVAAGSWVYASYAWNPAQTEARLAPAAGLPDVADLPGGLRHRIPSVQDCQTCHEAGGRPEVLGFNALQLSTDRDPGAIHLEPLRPGMVTLATLEGQRLLSPPQPDLVRTPPRIRAASPVERSVLGYLAANCGICHRADPVLDNLDLDLRASAWHTGRPVEPGVLSTVGHRGEYTIPGEPGPSLRIKPGAAGQSSVTTRMASRRPGAQMPPLATAVPDQEALARLRQWIGELPARPAPPAP